MSFTRRVIDGVTSLLEKVRADEAPLHEVDERELQAEAEQRDALRKAESARKPAENPLAKLAGGGAEAAKKRAEQQQARERRIRRAREEREAAARQADEDAFRRMREQAAREAASQSAGPRPGPTGAGRSSAGSGRGTGGRRGPFAGFGREAELAKHYKVLNLPYGAGFDEVKSAYRKLMRKYHPDLHNQSPKKQKAATELSMQVTQAYKALEKHLKD